MHKTLLAMLAVIISLDCITPETRARAVMLQSAARHDNGTAIFGSMFG